MLWSIAQLTLVSVSICATADRWLQLQTEGTRLLEQGKYDEARQSYVEALSVADEVGIVGSRLAQTLNNLGASCYHMARYAEAESLLPARHADLEAQCIAEYRS